MEPETQRYLELKQQIYKDKKDRLVILKQTQILTREAQFYEDKMTGDKFSVDNLNKRLHQLEEQRHELHQKGARLEILEKALSQFKDLEPTNEALDAQIALLRKSRLSLDMTFVDG